MKRAAVTILIISVAAIALVARNVLSANPEHAPAGQAVSTAAPKSKAPAATKAEAPSPPLQGRVALSVEQARDAFASGVVVLPVKSLLKVDRRMSYGDFVWNDRGVLDGPVWIRIDLKSQILSVFRSG